MHKSDLIEKYIQKRTTAEELEKIKRLMEEDLDFKEEVTFQLELREAIKKEESQKLKQYLQSLEQKKKRTLFVSEIWKIAAVFIIGLGLLWFFKMSPDYEKLYAENFEPYPNIVAPAVRDAGSTQSNIEKAFWYYDNRDYSKAAAAFKVLYSEDKIGYANFYYAISLMADDQVEKAVEALESPDWNISENYHNQVDWYLALGHLRIRNKEKAVAYFEKVIQADGPMAAKARKILTSIK